LKAQVFEGREKHHEKLQNDATDRVRVLVVVKNLRQTNLDKQRETGNGKGYHRSPTTQQKRKGGNLGFNKRAPGKVD